MVHTRNSQQTLQTKSVDATQATESGLQRRALIVGALGSGVIGKAWAQSKPRMKATLGVGSSSGLIAILALNVARTKNFFQDEGLDLDVTDFSSGAKGMQALIGRNVDLVAGSHEHTLLMHAKGADVRSIVALNNAPGIVIGITKSFAAKYTGVKDLKGAKIGVSSPGSSSQLIVNLLMSQNGLKGEDVSTIAVGTSAGAVAAIRSGGELQGISNYDPVMSELEGSGDIKPIVDLRSMEATRAFYKRDYVFVTIYTTADFIQKSPEVCQAIAGGIVRSLKWIQTATPEEILAQVPEQFWKSNRELYLKSIVNNLGGLSRDGRVSAEGTKTVYDGLMTHDKDVQKTKIDLSKTFDNRFVEKALANRPQGK